MPYFSTYLCLFVFWLCSQLSVLRDSLAVTLRSGFQSTAGSCRPMCVYFFSRFHNKSCNQNELLLITKNQNKIRRNRMKKNKTITNNAFRSTLPMLDQSSIVMHIVQRNRVRMLTIFKNWVLKKKIKKEGELMSRKCTVVHPRFTSELCFCFERGSSSRSGEKFLCVTVTPGLPSSRWFTLYLFSDSGFFVSVNFFQQMTSCSIIFVLFFYTSYCCVASLLLWHPFTFLIVFHFPQEKRDYKAVALDLNPTPRANWRLLWNFTLPN